MTERVSPGELTRKQETFLAAMLTLPTVGAAARAAGVSEKTAYVWLHRPEIKDAYKAARKQAFDAALDMLRDTVEAAIGTLRDMHTNEEAPHGVRVRAAQILLEQAITVHKLSEMEAEIAELKRAVLEREQQ